MEYLDKIYKLNKLIKGNYIFDSFMLLKDYNPGWTDGYLADLTGYNQELLQAQSKSAYENETITRFEVEREHCPELSKVLGNIGEYIEVQDISFNLEQSTDKIPAIDLISGYITRTINFKLLKHFVNRKVNCFDRLMIAKEETKPVRLYLDAMLIGLVMPLRTPQK